MSDEALKEISFTHILFDKVTAKLRVLRQISANEGSYGVQTQGLLDQAVHQARIIGSSLLGQSLLEPRLL